MDASLNVQLLGSPADGTDSPVFAWNSSVASFVADTDVASFADGSHLIAYITSDGATTQLFARRSDANGQATSDPFLVHDFGSMVVAGGSITVRVATFASGEYAILWRDIESLSGQRFYANNQAAGGPFLVTPTQTIGVFGFDIAAKSNGHLYVIWANGRRLPVIGVELDTQGNPVQPSQSIIFPTLGDMLEEITAAPGDNDGVVLSWRVAQTNPTGIGHKYQAFDSQWNALGNAQMIDSPTSGMGPEMLRLGSGRNVWAEQIFDASVSRLQIQVRDDQGQFIAPVFEASSNFSPLIPPQITAWAGRGFLLTYVESDNAGYHVYVRAFNNDGSPLTPSLLVADTLDLPLNQFRALGLTPDRFSVTWIDTANNPQSQELRERVWQLSTIPLSILVDAPVGLIDSGTHEIVVRNLPPTVGLNVGTQLDATSWRLSLEQAAQLQLVTHGPWPAVRVTVEVMEKLTGATLLSHDVSIGTSADDQFFLPDQVTGQVEGWQGYDQLVLPGASTDFLVEPMDVGQYHLTSASHNTDLYLSNVDAVMLSDGLFGVEDLIAPPPEPDPVIPDPVDPVVDPPVDPLPDNEPTDEPTEEPTEEPTTDDGSDEEDTVDAQETDLLGLYVFNGNVLSDPSPSWDTSPDLADFSGPSIENAGDSGDAVWQNLDWLESGPSSDGVGPMMASDDLNFPNDPPTSPLEDSPSDSVEPPDGPMDDLEPEGSTAEETPTELAPGDEPLEAPLDTLELSDAEAVLDARHAAASPGAENSRHHDSLGTGPSTSPGTSPGTRPSFARDTSPWNTTRQASAFRSSLFESARLAARTRLDDHSNLQRREASADEGVRFHSAELNVTTRFASQELFTEMDTIDQEVAQDIENRQLMVGTAVVVATGFSVAQIAWLLRGSLILTQTLSSLPIWIGFDPLPVLNNVPVGGLRPLTVGNDESLLDLVRQ